MTDHSSPTLLHHLRRALNHLYDPATLRASPLVAMLGLEAETDRAAALRRILIQAMEALKPDKSIPPEANAWRLYRILAQRFIEQSPQSEVAMDLGLGIRQYRRHEAQAIGVLADHLRAHHGLNPEAAWPTRNPATAPEPGTPSREQELAWLQESLPTAGPLDVPETVQAVLKLVGPLAQGLRVGVACSLPPDLPRLAGQLTTVRQVMLNILTAAIRQAPGGRVQVEADARHWAVTLTVRPLALSSGPRTLDPDDQEGLDMARQLAAMLGGTLRVTLGQGGRSPFVARLSLPAAAQVPVLVIDDNAGTLQLLERYTSGTRYRFVGTGDPGQALALAQESRARAIVLDVMLPGIDGWELLGRLHEHPSLRAVPIIVCTILPQEQLALSLGAAGFLRKPVSRCAFLAALDAQLAPGV